MRKVCHYDPKNHVTTHVTTMSPPCHHPCHSMSLNVYRMAYVAVVGKKIMSLAMSPKVILGVTFSSPRRGGKFTETSAFLGVRCNKIIAPIGVFLR
jgi:hypothetical protein